MTSIATICSDLLHAQTRERQLRFCEREWRPPEGWSSWDPVLCQLHVALLTQRREQIRCQQMLAVFSVAANDELGRPAA